MKHLIYYFKQDTENGDDVDLFTTREALAAAIEEAVANYSFDRGESRVELMRQEPFESAEWLACWEAFKDEQTDRQNYFSYGEQELDLPDPPATLPAAAAATLTPNDSTFTEELLAGVEKACFEAGRDNHHDHIMECLHECAQDNAERLLNEALDIGPGFEEASLSDLTHDQYDRLILAYKDGFWENCHVQERRELREALTRLLNCAELNQDMIEPETVDALAHANAVLDRHTAPQT